MKLSPTSDLQLSQIVETFSTLEGFLTFSKSFLLSDGNLSGERRLATRYVVTRLSTYFRSYIDIILDLLNVSIIFLSLSVSPYPNSKSLIASSIVELDIEDVGFVLV